MKKRIISLALAVLMLLGVCGCGGSGKDTEGSVSYITEWEEYEVEVDGEETDKDADKEDSSGKKDNSSSSSSGKKPSSTSSLKPQSGSVVKGLDFGGKTFTKTIIGAIPAKTIRKKEAFEKKFNCTIKLVNLQWEQYNSQVATAMSSGKPYDICGLQSFFWPEAGVQGLYEPLNKYIADEDLYNKKTGVGIDLDVSSEFALNGKYYGVSNHSGAFASMIQVMYYNKLMFEEAGFDDPLELYNKGKWTWDKFFEYAKEAKNASKGQYLMGQELSSTSFVLSNGYKYTTMKKGKVKENLSDSVYLKSLEKYKEFATKYMGPKGYSDDPTEFYNGNYYMFSQVYSYGTMYMYDTIVNSAAFDYDFDNLGVVPFPVGPNNKTKTNPGHGGQAKAAGKGSKDPRVVIAWTKFDLEFKDPMADEDPYRYSDKINNMISKMFDNVNDYLPNYKTASQSARALYTQIENAAKKGGDYVKLINDHKSTIQSIIDDSLGQ